LLALGPVPSFAPSRKAKRQEDADVHDDDEAEVDALATHAEPDRRPPNAKGTVLITLRNVPPYTLWSATFPCLPISWTE
jgi:25S rRNA (uracil2634-N3)-methyltransferase